MSRVSTKQYKLKYVAVLYYNEYESLFFLSADGRRRGYCTTLENEGRVLSSKSHQTPKNLDHDPVLSVQTSPFFDVCRTKIGSLSPPFTDVHPRRTPSRGGQIAAVGYYGAKKVVAFARAMLKKGKGATDDSSSALSSKIDDVEKAGAAVKGAVDEVRRKIPCKSPVRGIPPPEYHPRITTYRLFLISYQYLLYYFWAHGISPPSSTG